MAPNQAAPTPYPYRQIPYIVPVLFREFVIMALWGVTELCYELMMGAPSWPGHRGRDTHGTHGRTRAHGSHRRTSNHPNTRQHTRTTARRP